MASRLTELAAELVRGIRAPCVLDYATPEPPRHGQVVARLSNEVEYWGGYRYLGMLALGMGMIVAGLFFGEFGVLMEATGMLIVVGTRAWRTWNDMEL